MPWTKITRAQYLRNGLRYASDMTDAEWALIEPHLPAAKRLGRPRCVPLRAVVEALLYLLRTAAPGIEKKRVPCSGPASAPTCGKRTVTELGPEPTIASPVRPPSGLLSAV